MPSAASVDDYLSEPIDGHVSELSLPFSLTDLSGRGIHNAISVNVQERSENEIQQPLRGSRTSR